MVGKNESVMNLIKNVVDHQNGSQKEAAMSARSKSAVKELILRHVALFVVYS